MSESPRRPAQRVDLGASSGPAPWLDDSALVKSLREQLAASQAEVARLREALEFGLTDGGHVEGCIGAPYRVPCRCGREEFVAMAHNALATLDKGEEVQE